LRPSACPRMAMEFGVNGRPLWPQDSAGCLQATKLVIASFADPNPNILSISIFDVFSTPLVF
jgi:hypothetical protein